MFLISKLAWAIANPICLVLLLTIAGLAAAILGCRKNGLRLASGAAVFYLILAFSPLGDWLLSSLEKREAPAAINEIAGASGIIVLGGTLMHLSQGGTVSIYGFGGRMVEALDLARRFPSLPLIFSGGDASWLLRRDRSRAAEAASRFFTSAAIEPSRLRMENRSRNTYENAVFTAQLLNPKPQEKWVLVTSAFHMPRAKALFEGQGFQILPWPTDYQEKFRKVCFPRFLATEAICRVNTASREWAGRFFYWLRGDIAHL
jgi:uncharacterized SAM-binding protein YcdF (DUF218 family)